VLELLKKVQKLSQNYFLGLMSVIGLIGIMNTIGLWAVGLDHAVFFGFFAAMLTVIPYIGIFLGALLPVTFALLTQDSIWITGGVVLVFSVVQILESNFITPKIIGSKVSINPFVAIVALLLGSEIWGAAGMILSIPSTAILKVIFDSMESTKAIGYFLGNELTTKKKLAKSEESAV
jgi:predicted PurR-regulated permease PerM